MCRLLAYLGEPADPSALVYGGDHSLDRQSWEPRELLSGSVNADGYGVAWYDDDRPARIAEMRPIWYDPELRRTLAAIQSPCVFAALRNGTPGLPVDRAGLLPLVHDRWTFALNGFVPDFTDRHMRALRRELPDHLYARLRGASDAETLFLMTLSLIEEGATAVEALAAITHRVRARVGNDEAQLNMVLCDGRSIVAVRSGTGPETNSLYLVENPPFAPRGTVLASEPTHADAPWVAIGSHEAVEIGPQGVVRHDGILAK